MSQTVGATTCKETEVLISQGCSIELGDIFMVEIPKVYNLEKTTNFVAEYMYINI